MKTGKNRRRMTGLTLMETVIAIAIIAVTVPLIFAALGASGESRRSADDETRAAWLAKRVDDDVARGWADEGLFFERKLAYPQFGQADDERIFGFDREGDFRRVVTAAEWREGVKERGLVTVVKVSGTAYLPSELPGEELSKVEVVVAGPAVSPDEQRKKLSYYTLKSPSHD